MSLSMFPIGVLFRGTSSTMPGTSLVAASRILGSTRSQAEAITTPSSLRPGYLLRRSFSTPRPVNANRQTSRFKRAGASSAGTPTGAAGEGGHVGSVTSSPLASAPESLPIASAKSASPFPYRRLSPQKPKPSDPSSKEYKQTERKVISIIVGLPVLFVTSYYLYDRLSPFLAQRLSAAQQQHPEQRS
ncbi:uncharacterized protein B0T15DRAFT_205067 [Chaetomium strumarium]|uniref:Uncharacterized protein n=1 Tax=Chaetomium strumarium TaxID=1170767 RepID=A0AAJ0GTP9_9PEZI|nr:hypothetical protein B0T15DRAFT_205067 [Chaetomium strumarium]